MQSIFLITAIILVALTFVFPIVNYGMNGKIVATFTNYGLKVIDANGTSSVTHAGWNYIVATAVLVLILFCLSQFKKRKLQINLCRACYILLMFQAGYNSATMRNQIENLKFSGQKVIDSYGFGFYFPIIALFFILLAELFIKRDEGFVKSADRLR